METDVPQDAWAFRVKQWLARTGETLFGEWHRTKQWVRREGIYSGLVTHCGRVYSGEQMEMAGDPSKLPEGRMCFACFGLHDRHDLDVTGKPMRDPDDQMEYLGS